jgi:hypothetical protein
MLLPHLLVPLFFFNFLGDGLVMSPAIQIALVRL